MQSLRKILLLSPYDAMSHRFWRQGLTEYLTAQIENVEILNVTLPARYFSWRHRGNSLSLAFDERLNDKFDLLIATSVTDLSALKGMNERVSRVPAILYFHENQFIYPDEADSRLLERQLTSIYSALSCDAAIFNSDFNRTSFLEGAQGLLSKMPDQVPKELPRILATKSGVIPVALDDLAFRRANPKASTRSRPEGNRLRIAWNHRFEHDKGPLELLQLMSELVRREVDFELVLLGQRFKSEPPEFGQLINLLAPGKRLVHSGFVPDRSAYLDMLGECDLVLSTAHQEFQGLSVLEAMARGCIPCVPDRLSYREYVPPRFRYNTTGEAADLLTQWADKKRNHQLNSYTGQLKNYSWETVGQKWERLVSETM
jgi:glycosyltransferase involved in cell wall biosynthesis